MANSKFDFSALKPIKDKSYGWDESQLKPIETKSSGYIPYEEQGFLNKLPRNILAGLAERGHGLLNMPHDLVQNIEQQGDKFGAAMNIALPMQKYTKGNKPNKGKSLQQMVEEFNKTNKVPKSLQNPSWNKNISERIPHQEEKDFASMIGLKNAPTTLDTIIQKGTEFGPELLGAYGLTKSLAKKVLPQTSERIGDLMKNRKLTKEMGRIEEGAKGAESSAELLGIQENKAQQEADALKQQGNKQISTYLNKGADHSVRAASSLKHHIENIEKYWKKSYKYLKDTVKNNQFKMENLPNYTNDVEHALMNIKDLQVIDGKFVIKNKPELSSELQSIMDKAPTPNDILAEKFMTKYQDFRDARYHMLQRAKTSPSAVERQALFDAYKESKPIEEAVSKALNEGLGPHKAEFQRVNQGYSEHVYPIRNNKVAQKALKGNLGPNIIEDLAGFGEGQEVMRELVKRDPELLRNIVGQRYAAKPESLHDIGEATAEYLNEMPELKKIIDEHSKAMTKKLEEVNQHKQAKNISLEKKVKLEQESKQLKKRLERIEKDKTAIKNGSKKAGKVGAALLIGGPFALGALSKFINK